MLSETFCFLHTLHLLCVCKHIAQHRWTTKPKKKSKRYPCVFIKYIMTQCETGSCIAFMLKGAAAFYVAACFIFTIPSKLATAFNNKN